MNEAYNYAYDETLNSTQATLHGAQHPSYEIALNGTGNMVITDLRESGAKLTISKDISGTVFIRNSSDELVAEIKKAGNKNLTMALAPDSYSLVLRKNRNLYKADKKITGVPVFVAFNDFSRIKAEANVVRGGISDSRPESDFYGNLLAGYSLDELLFNNITVSGGFENVYVIANLSFTKSFFNKGAGAGFRFGFYRTFINFDGLFSWVGYQHSDGGKMLSLRLYPSFRVLDFMYVFGGASANFFFDKNDGYDNELVRRNKAKRIGIYGGVIFRIL
ncbi:MAG: hypothetical protein JXA66_02735 [Oligoflexia bacterium]|nr:hypothetical protein [Oligoflexia bacterium]